MREPGKLVAILTGSDALTALLTGVLAANPGLRVRPFDNLGGLCAYMELAPVDLVVADFDAEFAPADEVARALRFDTRLASRAYQIIALARHIEPNTRRAAKAMGIEEVIAKPMSPKFLLERVLSRTRKPRIGLVGADDCRRPELEGAHFTPTSDDVVFVGGTDNVVQLFRAFPVLMESEQEL